ncbi:MAG: hypothetical protein GDA41_10735 [Rhodospirillales bacterium]|nr:hypothetical protein [Rhodospirillales bacterium]
MNLIPVTAMATACVLSIEPRWEQLVGAVVVIFGVLQAQISPIRARAAVPD